jgi:PAS domain S-box-containing protein
MATTMYVLLTKQFEIVYINPSAVVASEAVLAKTPEVGDYLLDYVVDEQKDTLLNDLKKASKGEVVFKNKSILQDSQKKRTRFFSYRLKALKDGSGLLLMESVNYVVFDEMQQQIKERHEYLDTVMNTIGTGIKVSDAQGALIETNETYQKFLGYSAEELRGASALDCLIPEERQLAEIQLQRFLKEDIHPNRFWQLQHKDGTILTCDLAIEKVMLDNELRVIYSVTDITVQQKLEQSLKQTNAQTSALINNLAVMLWSVDEKMHFVTANQSAKSYFQENLRYTFTAGDKLTKVFAKVNSEQQEMRMKRYQEVLETGEPQHFEALEKHSGYLRHFSGEMHPILEQERIKGVSCFMEDDTGSFLRHTFSKGLSRFIINCAKAKSVSDVLLHLVQDLLHQLFIEEGEILVLEEDFLCPVVTYRHGEVKRNTRDKAPFELPVGKGVIGICASEKRTIVVDDSSSDMRVLTIGQAFSSEIAVPICVRDEVFGVINCESGSKGFFKPIFKEILEAAAKEAEEQIRKLLDAKKIREMESMQSAILNSTPNGYLLIDSALRIQSFNKMARMMLEDYRQAKLFLGQAYLEYVPEHEHQNFIAATKLARKGELVKVERSIVDHPLYSEEVWILVTFSPAYSSENEIFGVTLIIEDITETKKAEQVILEQNYQLKKANRELDDFVYSISHDVRAPLSSIEGLSGLIRQSNSLKEVMEYNDYIIDSTKRLDTYIRNILNFSRNKHRENKAEAIFLPELVQNVIHSNRFLALFDEIEFKYDIPDETISFDPFRFRLILDSVVSNAIKFQDKNKLEKFIALKVDIKEAGFEIFVKDNGQGIAKKQQERIFDMFYTANKNVRGNGVGLYILKETVDFLKGDIKVNSKFGKGTEIKITLPKPKHAHIAS